MRCFFMDPIVTRQQLVAADVKANHNQLCPKLTIDEPVRDGSRHGDDRVHGGDVGGVPHLNDIISKILRVNKSMIASSLCYKWCLRRDYCIATCCIIHTHISECLCVCVW